MKKIAKYFLITFISAFAMFFIMKTSVSANYDPNKNYANISISKEGVTITATYQRGIAGQSTSSNTGKYVWCDGDMESSCAENDNNVVKFNENDIVSKSPASYADNNLSTKTFVIKAENDPKLRNWASLYDSSNPDKKYTIFVYIHYCTTRDAKNDNDEYTKCKSWDSDKGILRLSIDSSMFKDSNFFTGTTVGDEKINGLLQQITDIVYEIVLPVIWGLLGIFLVIKGSILGVQIVKSADEPQVRQEKVGSLKWLVIGVAIAYGATGVIKALEGIISDLVGGASK